MYQHRTFNHLTFDYIRQVQFQVRLLRSYIRDEAASGGYGAILDALNEIDTLLFDDVYKPLRDRWLN